MNQITTDMNTDILNENIDITNEIAIDLFGNDYRLLSDEESDLVDQLTVMVRKRCQWLSAKW